MSRLERKRTDLRSSERTEVGFLLGTVSIASGFEFTHKHLRIQGAAAATGTESARRPIIPPSMMRLLICHITHRSCRPGVGASYGLNLKLSQEAFPRELRQSIVPRQLELRAPPRSKLKLLL